MAECKEKTCQNNPDDAADRAVKKVFAILGVDVDSPRDVEEFRRSLRFGDSMRKFADKGMMAFAVALVGLLFAALLTGLKVKLGG